MKYIMKHNKRVLTNEFWCSDDRTQQGSKLADQGV